MSDKLFLGMIISASIIGGSILVAKGIDKIKSSSPVVYELAYTKSTQPATQLASRSSNENQLSSLVKQNKDLRETINKYSTQTTKYQSALETLQYTIDSLEVVCARQQDENSTLELYAIEYDNMNKRYGNLPFTIEKKISTYLSK